MKLRKKFSSSIILILLFTLYSCASSNLEDSNAPEWYRLLEESDNGSCYTIKVHTVSTSQEEALSKAAEDLSEEILEKTELLSAFSTKKDKAFLISEIEKIISEEPSFLQEYLSLENQEWLMAGVRHLYYGAFCLQKNAKDFIVDHIIEESYQDDTTLQELLNNAARYEAEGKLFLSAEALLEAAVFVSSSGKPFSTELAQSYINRSEKLLLRISTQSVGAPDKMSANQQIRDAFYFHSTDGDVPVPAVEYIVRYEGRKRDGGRAFFERRLASNDSGIIEFFHPFIPFTGNVTIAFEPGNMEFRSRLDEIENAGFDAAGLRNWVENFSFSYDYQVESSAREIPMGVLVLHTDITGAALGLTDTASSLIEFLDKDGFDVRILSLDPGELSRKSEEEFLRDIKALYQNEVDRIVFSLVRIDDFESRGESYWVNAVGYLKVADLKSQEILHVSESSKSVESRSNTQVISAAFRELGRSFADQLIESLE